MSFKEVIGQDQAVNYLVKCALAGRLYQSYLFIGPQGVGKFLVAKNFAKLLNCLQKDSGPCDKCSSCIKIENNNHPDIHFIGKDPSGSIGIETVRELERLINLKPFEAKKKVFIIDNAQSLTAKAANALLKTIEEPPKDSVIILITAQIKLLFSTIVSRCQKVRFSIMGIEKLTQILQQKYRLFPAEAHFLAHISGGRLQEALRFKEENLTEQKNRIIDLILKKREPILESFLENTLDKNKTRDLLMILLGLFRDILLVKIGSPCDLLINIDRKDEISSSRDRFTIQYLEEIISDIVSLNIYLEQNINLKIALNWLSARLSMKEQAYERSSLS